MRVNDGVLQAMSAYRGAERFVIFIVHQETDRALVWDGTPAGTLLPPRTSLRDLDDWHWTLWDRSSRSCLDEDSGAGGAARIRARLWELKTKMAVPE